MAWVYGDPPFTKHEKETYVRLNRKLKNREYAERIVKVLSLFMYIRKHKFKDWKELQESVFFDDAKTQPIFDDKTAKAVFRLSQQKGGSQYPFINGLINKGFETVGSVLPTIITEPISLAYNGVTGAFTTAVEYIPFADLALELGKSGAAVTTVAIENLAGAVGGAPAEVIAFLVTFVIASAAASIHLLERDFGGAIEQIFRSIPVIGTVMQTVLQKAEGIGSKVDKQYESLADHFDTVKNAFSRAVSSVTDEGTVQSKLEAIKAHPMAQQLKDKGSQLKTSAQDRLAAFKESDTYKNIQGRAQQLRSKYMPSQSAETTAGKRLSTMKHSSKQWLKKTQRKRSATR